MGQLCTISYIAQVRVLLTYHVVHMHKLHSIVVTVHTHKTLAYMQGQPQSEHEDCLDPANAITVPDSQPEERQPGGLPNPLQPLQFTAEQKPFFSQQPSVLLPTGLVYQVLCSLPGYSFIRKCCTSSDAAAWMQSMLEARSHETRYACKPGA